MKKTIYYFGLLFILSIAMISCDENKSAGEKLKDKVEDVGDGIEDGVEEVGDEIDDVIDN